MASDNNRQDDDKNCNYLILGDGDFSYSLDLCRYLSLHSSFEQQQQQGQQQGQQSLSSYRIVCTGIDTLDQLNVKYRDCNFILREILSLNTVICESKGRKSPRLKCDVIAAIPLNHLHISIHQGVNAIVPWHNEEDSFGTPATSSSIDPKPPLPTDVHFRYVIFNYPHLGKEDAQLHSRFLAHLFYSVYHYWLAHTQERSNNSSDFMTAKNNCPTITLPISHSDYEKSTHFYGTFHLTLAKGQCERWNCLQAAHDQGLILLHRGYFCIPPLYSSALSSPNNNISSSYSSQSNIKSPRLVKNQYQLRRHHSGQSFNKQIWKDGGGGETFIFGRKQEWSTTTHHMSSTTTSTPPLNNTETIKSCFLPWQNLSSSSSSSSSSSMIHTSSSHDSSTNTITSCSICGKLFQDERARKDHVKFVHDTSTTTSSSSSTTNYICELCPNNRSFSNEKALTDHKIAKHVGLYTDIKPVWASTNQKCIVIDIEEDSNTSINDEITKCTVCSLPLKNQTAKQNHILELLPIQDYNTSVPISSTIFPCSKCSKGFCDQRSQFQHENFCRYTPAKI